MIVKGRAVQIAGAVLRVGDRVPMGGGNSTFHALDGSRAYLVKEFAAPAVGAEAERLTRLVERTANLAKDARVPVRSVAWPQALVRAATGAVEAVVIQRAPQSFYRPDRNALFEPVQNLGHLFSARPPLPSLRLRLVVAYNLAAALDVIEYQTLYHGDVSHGNVLWSSDGSIFLIDCDGIRAQGEKSGHRGTPAWVDPRLSGRMIDSHDVYSDRYALALLIARAYAGERFDFDPVAEGLRGDIPPEIRRRLEPIFQGDLRARLRPQEWMPILAKAIQGPARVLRPWATKIGEPSSSTQPAQSGSMARLLAITNAPASQGPPPKKTPDPLPDATVEEVHKAMKARTGPPPPPPRKKKKRSGRRR